MSTSFSEPEIEIEVLSEPLSARLFVRKEMDLEVRFSIARSLAVIFQATIERVEL